VRQQQEKMSPQFGIPLYCGPAPSLNLLSSHYQSRHLDFTENSGRA